MTEKYQSTADAMTVIEEEAKAVAQCFGVVDCEAAAAALRDRIVMRLGGGTIYIPKTRLARRAAVREGIMRDFDGKNGRTVAQRYGVSHRYVQLLVARHRQ